MSGTRQVRCGFGDDSGQLLTQWVALIGDFGPGAAYALRLGHKRRKLTDDVIDGTRMPVCAKQKRRAVAP
jgi:hypothetical protein